MQDTRYMCHVEGLALHSDDTVSQPGKCGRASGPDLQLMSLRFISNQSALLGVHSVLQQCEGLAVHHISIRGGANCAGPGPRIVATRCHDSVRLGAEPRGESLHGTPLHPPAAAHAPVRKCSCSIFWGNVVIREEEGMMS